MAIKVAGVDVINDDRELVLAKLTEINETINDTAVDVFVYDTSKDSDGGAWRHRTQHTSWYNEASSSTRGSRAEFPAVAVIVAESNKVTIYDGDDPSLPMWMVFNGNSINHLRLAVTGIFALNGYLAWSSSTSGAGWSNFAEDASFYMAATFFRQSLGSISQRNSLLGFAVLSTSIGIVNSAVNDVAMTVLPDAPTDPATGLEIPTIAVATDGGVSVIKDDGTVVDSSQTFPIDAVAFRGNGDVCYRRDGSPEIYAATSYAADGFGSRIYDFDLQPYAFLFGSSGVGFSSNGDNLFVGRNVGLETYLENPTTPANGMVAYTTSDYTTGWMPGDIKLAALADTDDTDLVGSDLSPTAGDFTLPTGWSWDGTTLSYDGTGTANSRAYFPTTSLLGDYVLVFTISAISGNNVFYGLGNSTAATTIISGGSTNTTGEVAWSFSVPATSNATVYFQNNLAGGSISITPIALNKGDADRSVNNNNLIINGTVSRDPVATGADVVAYSGFSASNYLEQPYNDDLDFGTGDFCVMGWAKANTGITGSDVILRRSDTGSTGARFAVYRSGSTDDLRFELYDGSNLATAEDATNHPTEVWMFICGVYTGGDTVYLYRNGELVGSADASSVGNMNNTSAVTRIGLDVDGTAAFAGSLALWRISATAPTADQIAKIYNDEKVLFQDSAKATLTGSSDAVTALAHDPDTDLLHVGTSGGRSVFHGLRRVEEHTGTDSQSLAAISAVDGLVVEGK